MLGIPQLIEPSMRLFAGINHSYVSQSFIAEPFCGSANARRVGAVVRTAFRYACEHPSEQLAIFGAHSIGIRVELKLGAFILAVVSCA